MKKRFLSIITALALCLSLLPAAALAAEPVAGVTYLDENGDEKTRASAKVVESDTIQWVHNWYVVQGTVEIDRRVVVSSDVRLILTDGCELIINGGIQVQDDDEEPDNGSRNTLTIYGQAGGTGKLTIRNVEEYDAGIGGTVSSAYGHDCGEITINGGYIEATSLRGAGIGGGYSSATGGYGGIITINGGTVTATSTHGAGIGGGVGGSSAGGNGGKITINGGTVTATSSSGAGIGGGNSNRDGGAGGEITITGGIVEAISTKGEGIGGGYGDSSRGSNGTFQTNNGNAVIFASSIGDQSNQSSWSGIIFEGDSGVVHGNQTLTGDLTIPADKTLTVPSDTSLTIPEDVTLTIAEGGTLTNNGTIIKFGTLTNNGTFTGSQPKSNTMYLDANGGEKTAVCTVITADNIDTYGTLNAGWYVVTGAVTMGTADVPKRITVSGEVYLILADHCDFTVKGGIQVQDDDADITNGSANALTIYAQSAEESTMGRLTAQNAVNGNAGIGGGGYVGNGGTITINGGTVKATGGDGAAIGGGGSSSPGGYNAGGSGGIITINGGSVTATCDSGGAGIGGGVGLNWGNDSSGGYSAGGSGGTITINGGTVNATSTTGAGIGGGGGNNGGIGGEITISGGTVETTSIGGGKSIGSEQNGAPGTFQTTNNGSAVIFASSIGDQRGKESDAWSGIIFEGDADGKVYGTSVTPIEDFTIDSGKTLLIPESAALTIADITAVNSGSVYVDGALTGTVSGDGGVYYPLTVNGGTASTTCDYNSKTYGKAGEAITLTGTNIPAEQVLDGWTTSNSAVTVENNAFTMPNSALIVTARIKTIGTVSIDNPGKEYDGQPVSMGGKYTANGDGAVTVEYKAQNAEDATYAQNAPTGAGSYTVRVSVAASDNYTAASATRDFTITKAAQTAPTPTVKSKTYNSVELEQIPDNANGAKAQYSMDGGATWQDSPEFTDLTPSTAYNFVARYRETDNYFASPVSTELSVTTSTTPSSGGSSTPTYPPTVTQPENGSVTVSPKSPRKGVTVTITPTPDAGYTVEQVLVTDKNGDPVEVINNGDGTYSFTQPAGKVNINVTFMEDNSMLNFFVDVFPGDYYYDAVLWAAENGITGGVDDTHFAPNANCTRAQIVTFLWRAAGSPVVNYAMNFSDVPADAYYAEAVRWAVSQGITKGTGDTTFSSNATCTRAQAMTFIYRSEQAQGGGMQGTWMFQNPFSDVDLENYYGEAVMWAVANGVTNGTSDTTFSPGADCTRAQIVTFLYRFFVK